MGKLYKRGDTWYADYFDRDGNRRQKSTRTGDKRVAQQRLRDLELATTDRGTDAEEGEPFHAALDYFTGVVCASKPKATRESYEQKARHLARWLGDIPITALTREHVERYIAQRVKDEHAHPHTVHKELVVLRGTLKARSRGVEIVPKFEHAYEPRRTYLTPEQFRALCDHLVQPLPPRASEEARAASDLRRAKRVFYCVLIAFASPRRGELEALDWQRDVSIARNMIRIPKGKTVSREVAIADELRPWLIAFGERAHWRGRLVEPWKSVVRDLGWACKRAGVPRVTPNDLRRTFASWLVQGHVSLFVVATLLGHSSTTMVEKVYGKLDAATLAGAVARLPSFSAAPAALHAGREDRALDGDCNAGVTPSAAALGKQGSAGNSIATASITNSVENSVDSTGSEVPRDGVEPPTRGFSGLSAAALRAVVTDGERRASPKRLKIVR